MFNKVINTPLECLYKLHCKKCPYSEFFWSVFPVFGLNTVMYRVNLRIKSPNVAKYRAENFEYGHCSCNKVKQKSKQLKLYQFFRVLNSKSFLNCFLYFKFLFILWQGHPPDTPRTTSRIKMYKSAFCFLKFICTTISSRTELLLKNLQNLKGNICA